MHSKIRTRTHSFQTAELTKPGEVGEIIALYRLKSLSLDYKAKLKWPCFFLQVTLFLQIIFVLW
jgi:hypothetical protein